MLWIDIDEAPRKIMVKSTVMRREQVVGDMVQLFLDLEHWNRKNSDEKPIVLVTDVTDDINERLAGPNESAA
jgi:predicted P-loop ATPase